MKLKKVWWIFGIIVVLAVILLFLRGQEDSWIKDSSGVWVKHGNPNSVPVKVLEQQAAVNCAKILYQQQNKSELNSQCIGTCSDYSVDIVNVPRTHEDDLQENQCQDYREGKTTGFIELDKDGNIIRIN